MTRELITGHHLCNNNHRKNNTAPSPCQSGAVLFFKWSCCSAQQCPRSLLCHCVSTLRRPLWPSEARSLWFTSVSKRRWLIVRHSMWEQGSQRRFMDSLSHLFVSKYLLSIPPPGSLTNRGNRFKHTFALERASRAADGRCGQIG